MKKLPPGAPGTKRLAEHFGAALVCVRYRVDAPSRRRYTTVELVVEENELGVRLPEEVFVRIAYGEVDLRRQVKRAGGRWDPDRKLWCLPRKQVRALGLLQRVASARQTA